MMIPHEVSIAVGVFFVAATFLQLVLDAHNAVNKDGTRAVASLLVRYIGTFAAMYMFLRACGIL